MTDKQIIIDGVDVSGCDRLNTFPMQYGEPHEICLTSLEQWGGQEKYCKDRPNCYYKKWQRKEQECEELKSLLKVRIEDLCDSCGASSMMPMPCKVYEKTLTEIKEIAENAYCLTNGTNKDMANFAKQILQKISECEVE